MEGCDVSAQAACGSTKLEVTTGGDRLIITPIRPEATRKHKQVRAQTRTNANHASTPVYRQ